MSVPVVWVGHGWWNEPFLSPILLQPLLLLLLLLSSAATVAEVLAVLATHKRDSSRGSHRKITRARRARKY